jgi:hypothetical protein
MIQIIGEEENLEDRGEKSIYSCLSMWTCGIISLCGIMSLELRDV